MNIAVTYEIMNKIFFEISDKYGWENVPYSYSANKFTERVGKIEICMWRYDVKFINKLFETYAIKSKVTKDDTIFLEAP